MQYIIIKTEVEIPNVPLFRAGQKVRVSDKIADLLVERGHAKYDQGKEPKTDKAKKVLKKPVEKKEKK